MSVKKNRERSPQTESNLSIAIQNGADRHGVFNLCRESISAAIVRLLRFTRIFLTIDNRQGIVVTRLTMLNEIE